MPGEPAAGQRPANGHGVGLFGDPGDFTKGQGGGGNAARGDYPEEGVVGG